MDAVGDEAGAQAVLGKLRDHRVVEFGQQVVQAIAQMRAELRAGIDRGGDVRGRCRRMAQGDDLAALAGPADQVDRARPLRRDGQQQDGAAQRCFEPLDQRGVGGQHRRGRVAAGVAFLRGLRKGPSR